MALFSSNNLTAVKINNLNKFYTEGETRHQILDSIDIEFITSKFTVLLGKSGSGKSTILNLISGIDVPDNGDIWISNTPITKLSEKERTLFRRDNIGIIFQFFNLIPTLTVLENVTLPQELSGKNQADCISSAMNILERVGMSNRCKAFPDKLSGGEQQRVAIARALAHNPSLILADEPTGNLDTETGKQVLQLLLELTREAGKTMIMATHSTDIIPFADDVFTLQKGKLVKSDV